MPPTDRYTVVKSVWKARYASYRYTVVQHAWKGYNHLSRQEGRDVNVHQRRGEKDDRPSGMDRSESIDRSGRGTSNAPRCKYSKFQQINFAGA